MNISQNFFWLLCVCMLPLGGQSANHTPAVQVEYSFSHIWGLDNQNSGAPGPVCPCDVNPDVQDCPAQGFTSTADLGSQCSDEYIPQGSRGWVHATIFKKESAIKSISSPPIKVCFDDEEDCPFPPMIH